ncbi:endonuclease III [Candidatus Pacearchaeota archaeon]|nr:endonuclease III [Candidatus Pacearchaeota archaeon]
MEEKNIPQIMKALSKKYPASTTTLNNLRGEGDAFKILTSCLLSLRTRDEVTEVVSENLFEIADTPEKIIKLDLDKLKRIIFKTGHYNKKAATLKHVSEEVLGRFGGVVPATYDELISIKGIGPKTANIVLAFAYGEAVIPVDTHCHRIPNRLGWVKTKLAEQTEGELLKILPKKYYREFNSIFVQFGRDICVPISPKCSVCPIEKYCKKINVKKSR